MRTLFLLALLLFSCESKIKITKINQDNDVESLSLPNNFSYTSNPSNNNTEIPNLTFDHEGDSIDYCLGSSSGNCDIIDWSNTTTNNINDSGLSLSDGTYFIQLKSKKGNQESDIVEVEFIIDTTPPSLVSALSLSSSLTNSSTNSPTISFTNPSESDFNKTQYCIGTSNITCNIQALSDTPSNSFSASGLSLGDGTYFVNIQSLDNLDNTSSFASESWTVDTTNPDPVTALSISDSNSTTNSGTITFTGSGSGDVNRYEYSIGTTSGDNNLVDWTSIGTSTSFSNSSLSLTGGNTYFVNVRTIDNAGNPSTVETDSWTVDTTNPDPVTALSAPDNGDTTSSGTITFTGSGSGDVNRYEYSIGTTSGDNNLVDWTSIGTSTSFTATGLSLTIGNTYYVNIRVFDEVGNMSLVETDSWIVTTPPVVSASNFLTQVGSYSVRPTWGRDVIFYNNKIYLLGRFFLNGLEDSPGLEGSNIFVMCYNSDLTIDTSFGTSGYRLITGEIGASDKDDYPGDIKIYNDKIWISGLFGSDNGTSSHQWGIASLNLDGSMNTDWSGDGVYIYNDSVGWNEFSGSFDGEIFPHANGVLMMFSDGTPSEPTFYALNTDTSLNTSFDSDGIAEASDLFGADGNNFRGVISSRIASDGSIVFNGKDTFGYAYYGKIRSNLSLDTTFNTSGYLLSSSLFYNGSKGEIDLDSSNVIWNFVDYPSDGAILSVSSSGIENPSFGGGDGERIVSSSNAYYGGVATSSGLYAVGWSSDTYISKLSLTGSVDTSFESSGYYMEATSGLNWGTFVSFIKASDNQAIWLGQRGGTSRPMLVLFNLN